MIADSQQLLVATATTAWFNLLRKLAFTVIWIAKAIPDYGYGQRCAA
jgi:hypothetical protein